MRSAIKPHRMGDRLAAIADETIGGATNFVVIAKIIGGGDANPKSMCPRGVPLQVCCCVPV